MLIKEADKNSIHSKLRERIVEHLFVGEVLKWHWQRDLFDVEVLRDEFDAHGYDLVLSRDETVRHIQFKTVLVDGKAAKTDVSLKLMEKPSGCVIWIVVTPELDFASYLWFGGKPGKPLSSMDGMKVAKHSKGNASGAKTLRPNHRTVPRSKFVRLDTLDAVIHRLFGTLT